MDLESISFCRADRDLQRLIKSWFCLESDRRVF